MAALSLVLLAQVPDTAVQARYSVAMRRVNDSLTALDGAAAMFQADLVHASPDLVISRATRLRQHCVGTRRETGRLDSLPALVALLRPALTNLRTELARCDREFASGPWYQGVDSVKAWAPHRLTRLGDAVRRFRMAARAYMPKPSSR